MKKNKKTPKPSAYPRIVDADPPTPADGFGLITTIDGGYERSCRAVGYVGGVKCVIFLAIDSAVGSEEGKPRIRRVRASVQRVVEP